MDDASSIVMVVVVTMGITRGWRVIDSWGRRRVINSWGRRRVIDSWGRRLIDGWWWRRLLVDYNRRWSVVRMNGIVNCILFGSCK